MFTRSSAALKHLAIYSLKLSLGTSSHVVGERYVRASWSSAAIVVVGVAMLERVVKWLCNECIIL